MRNLEQHERAGHDHGGGKDHDAYEEKEPDPVAVARLAHWGTGVGTRVVVPPASQVTVSLRVTTHGPAVWVQARSTSAAALAASAARIVGT